MRAHFGFTPLHTSIRHELSFVTLVLQQAVQRPTPPESTGDLPAEGCPVPGHPTARWHGRWPTPLPQRPLASLSPFLCRILILATQTSLGASGPFDAFQFLSQTAHTAARRLGCRRGCSTAPIETAGRRIFWCIAHLRRGRVSQIVRDCGDDEHLLRAQLPRARHRGSCTCKVRSASSLCWTATGTAMATGSCRDLSVPRTLEQFSSRSCSTAIDDEPMMRGEEDSRAPKMTLFDTDTTVTNTTIRLCAAYDSKGGKYTS